ncbi:hypothetical protein GJ496_009593 [Pomphorhynchus laevis]|nr:hypothetical protein GJ496_009593 [Pomphorhynchus laevis]
MDGSLMNLKKTSIKQKIYADLNMQHTSNNNTLKLLKCAHKYGFTDIAFSVDFNLSDVKRKIKSNRKRDTDGIVLISSEQTWKFPEPPSILQNAEINQYLKDHNDIHVFNRINVTIDDNQNLSLLRCDLVKKFDLISISPTSLDTLKFICQSNSFKPEIISLDQLKFNETLPIPVSADMQSGPVALLFVSRFKPTSISLHDNNLLSCRCSVEFLTCSIFEEQLRRYSNEQSEHK